MCSAYKDYGVVRKVNRLSMLKGRRKFWLDVHLYLGLSLGLILAVIGLTGSILVFWTEIDEWLNSEMLIVSTPNEYGINYRPLQEIFTTAEAVRPPDAKLYAVIYPRNNDTVFCFWYKAKTKPDEDQTYPNIFVNPYTAKVTGMRNFYASINPLKINRSTLMGFIFNLHYRFLFGEAGIFIIGILSVFFIISVFTGLILWWPLTGKWRQALSLKRNASPERFNFDLHKTFGFYSTIVLLAVLFSGFSMNLGEEFKWLVERFSPVTDPFSMNSTRRPDELPLSPASIAEIMTNKKGEGRLHGFYMPSEETGVYVFEHKEIPSLSRFVIDTRKFSVDQFTGKILHVADPITGSAGDVFTQWQWPLHSGQAFGWTGRILVFLSGLACPVLFVTGVIRWLQKRNAYRSHKSRQPGKAQSIINP
ncbi:MAG: PepSY domain-containing protein [Methyloglobulus sp.]|nr:PepSY domain-containing protein [Methyloglobulus sp.]